MWNQTQIELLLENELNTLESSILSPDKFYGQYKQVRQYMCDEIYNNIARKEPNLSDHGEKHIRNVLINAYKLIKYSLGDKEIQYTPLDLYALCSAILIHDVGNIHGREGHEHSLAKVYTTNTAFSGIDNTEKIIISKIAISHGGEENAISNLSDEHISGEKIQSQCIAGLLRFADELAEGPQRTSPYLINNNLLSQESRVYHEYANISDMPVIKQDSIILKYNIILSKFSKTKLEVLLILLYKRIYKLNRERINCGTYSKHIQRIKKVAVTINFYQKDGEIDTIDGIENTLKSFELNNLDCNKIEECKVKEKYINKLMLELQQYY